jgi:NAD(P)-dependent dehydrogenase (short-subunit alcohol dehydrogenase family)
MMFDLTGKVALVTGSSRGIGRAMVTRMAEAGAKVVVSSRKAEICEQVAASINELVGEDRAIAIPANISSKEEIKGLVEKVELKLGHIDILACNAASNPYHGTMDGISDEQFRKVLENNILANHWLIQLVSKGMIERREGSIIIVSSIGGFRGSTTIGAYNISKAADMQLARNFAVELGPYNIRVNCIAPGLIKTDFARALWEDPTSLEAYTGNTPLRRIGQPDEVAGAAIFLASTAGSFVSGHTLVVDGGLTISGP